MYAGGKDLLRQRKCLFALHTQLDTHSPALVHSLSLSLSLCRLFSLKITHAAGYWHHLLYKLFQLETFKYQSTLQRCIPGSHLKLGALFVEFAPGWNGVQATCQVELGKIWTRAKQRLLVDLDSVLRKQGEANG